MEIHCVHGGDSANLPVVTSWTAVSFSGEPVPLPPILLHSQYTTVALRALPATFTLHCAQTVMIPPRHVRHVSESKV